MNLGPNPHSSLKCIGFGLFFSIHQIIKEKKEQKHKALSPNNLLYLLFKQLVFSRDNVSITSSIYSAEVEGSLFQGLGCSLF